jgi:hypothetical protein
MLKLTNILAISKYWAKFAVNNIRNPYPIIWPGFRLASRSQNETTSPTRLPPCGAWPLCIGYLVIITPFLPLLILRNESPVKRYMPVSCDTRPRTIHEFRFLDLAHCVSFFRITYGFNGTRGARSQMLFGINRSARKFSAIYWFCKTLSRQI